MQVTISVPGRFHAFYLAQQLLKYGYMERLITSYPRFEVVKYGIPKNKIKSIVIKEVLERGWDEFPFVKKIYNPQYVISEIYDTWASNLCTKTNIHVGFSGYSLNTLKKAKKMGSITVLERGSSHILYQTQILLEEYDKLGLMPRVAHPKIIEKELKEYLEADYISVPSLFAKQSFLEYGIPETKLIHIPYGVHLNEFRQIPKEDNIFRVVYAGAMSIQKGIHYLLQAFSELKIPNSELLLVGGISDEIRPFFNRYKNNLKWVNHVPQKELYKYYSQGSIFVILSIQEGLAMVQAQAMACGLPVICTTNTGGGVLLSQ